MEADSHTLRGGDQNMIVAFRADHIDQLIIFVQRNGADTGFPVGAQRNKGNTLNRTLLGHHHQIFMLMEFSGDHHSRDGLLRQQRQNVDHSRTAGSSSGLGDLIALPMVDTAHIGEEQNVVMGRCHIEALNKVLFLQILSIDTTAATALGAVSVYGHTLYIALVGNGKDTSLFLNEIFNVDFILHILDLSLAVITKLIPDRDQFFTEDTLQLFGVCQQFLVVANPLLKFIKFCLEFFTIQTLERFQTHIQNSLSLNIIQTKPLAEFFLRIVISRTDDTDDLVDIILRDQQALQ